MFYVVLLVLTSNTLAFRPYPSIKYNLKRSFLAINSLPSSSISLEDPNPLQNYINFWSDTYHKLDIQLPDYVVHWGHAVAMSSVLLTMVSVGVYLGFQIRYGSGGKYFPFTLGKTAREQHPLIMAGAYFFFLLGGQGGLVSVAIEGKPNFTSVHATTAAITLVLFGLQVSSIFIFLLRTSI